MSLESIGEGVSFAIFYAMGKSSEDPDGQSNKSELGKVRFHFVDIKGLFSQRLPCSLNRWPVSVLVEVKQSRRTKPRDNEFGTLGLRQRSIRQAFRVQYS